MEQIVFSILLSLLFVHEMDAIRAKEWNMFILLKDRREAAAYRVFVILHLPLYGILLYALSIGPAYPLKFAGDFFCLGHGVLHWGFRKHKNNGFSSLFSKMIIGGMTVLSVIHLYLLYGRRRSAVCTMR